MGKAQTRASNKYAAKAYDQLRVLVKKGEKEKIKAHAESLNMSLNAYIVALIEKDMENAHLE